VATGVSLAALDVLHEWGKACVANGGGGVYGEVAEDMGKGELVRGVAAAVTLQGSAVGMQVYWISYFERAAVKLFSRGMFFVYRAFVPFSRTVGGSPVWNEI